MKEIKLFSNKISAALQPFIVKIIKLLQIFWEVRNEEFRKIPLLPLWKAMGVLYTK